MFSFFIYIILNYLCTQGEELFLFYTFQKVKLLNLLPNLNTNVNSNTLYKKQVKNIFYILYINNL